MGTSGGFWPIVAGFWAGMAWAIWGMWYYPPADTRTVNFMIGVSLFFVVVYALGARGVRR